MLPQPMIPTRYRAIRASPPVRSVECRARRESCPHSKLRARNSQPTSSRETGHNMSEGSRRQDRPGQIAEIKYGKANVSFYRTYARPLEGVTPIPESSFAGRPNTLFAYDVEVQVLDQTLAPAYTEGDNSLVVATDTMKNFIHQVAIEFEGATLEEYLLFLGRRFFRTWSHVSSLRLSGRE